MSATSPKPLTYSADLKERMLGLLADAASAMQGYENTRLFRLIERSTERIEQPMQLAVIGKISSSKSTLVNALLGAPEVVRTGQMEETFNVSWLRYGERFSRIKVVFKDGHTEEVAADEWTDWTSHQAPNSLKENVRYIDVPYPAGILREINIIDTPGLDALTQIDSRNTIAFLKEVKPDAVIMLFTKSIAESTMSVLQDFQGIGNGDFNLTALNAIGVLAKADTMWSPFDDDEDIIAKGNRVVKSTLYDKYPEVRRSLFSILPVSSLMGLGAHTLSDTDILSLRQLAMVEPDIVMEMLSSPDFFLDEDYRIGLGVPERTALYCKFGLYGISVLVKTLRDNKDADKDFLSGMLLSKSGFDKLRLTIISHFGRRATLIKAQGILRDLLSEIRKTKTEASGGLKQAVAEVENRVVSAMLSLHESKEWEYLSRYYDGVLDIPPQEAEEFLALCGERGYSAPDRLGLQPGATTQQLLDRAIDRSMHWKREANIISTLDPDSADFYKTIASSYNHLHKKILMTVKARNRAKETLEETSAFLGTSR